MATSPVLNFISWKPEYDCQVSLINCQHQEVLVFLNSWYLDLKLSCYHADDLYGFLKHRLDFLVHYSDFHLDFEEDMLILLCQKYGFPRDEYEKHVKAHNEFKSVYLGGLRQQIDIFSKSGSDVLTDSLLLEILKDIATWWYTHIRTPRDSKPGGPDSVYRKFMDSMDWRQIKELLNDLLIAGELKV